MLTIIIITIIIALVYDFLNGMNDAANSIATIVSTKVLPPGIAVIWAAVFNFSAVFFLGISVANTIGKGIVQAEYVDTALILTSLIGSGIWVFFCTYFGLPISVSHALIGGLIGSGLVKGGIQALVAGGIIKTAIFIIISPVLGLLLGHIFMILAIWAYRNANPQKVRYHFNYMQLISSAVFSMGHGGNDAQKTMGIIAILLYSNGYLGDTFYIPTWVIISAYAAISLGTLAGGRKVIKTLGVGLTDLKPLGGFCAESAASITLIGIAVLGIPVSTTHTITGAIMGVGATKRFSAVRWIVAYNIVIAWVLTIPLSALMSSLVYLIIRLTGLA